MREAWRHGEVAVVGLARSGRAAAQLLSRAGTTVYASDAAKSSELEETAAVLLGDRVDVELGRDRKSVV